MQNNNMTDTNQNKPSSSSNKSKITVCVRLRPTIKEDLLHANAIRNSPEICVHLKSDGQNIKLIQDRFHSRMFKVDHTFGMTTSQTEVYDIGMKPIILDVLKGHNGTGIVYGQTSSGKTYTMFGSDNKLGIAHFAISDIFNRIQQYEENNLVGKVFMSFYQIYVEQIYDLLADTSQASSLSSNNNNNSSNNNNHNNKVGIGSTPNPLNIREDAVRGIHVENLSTYHIKDKATAHALIKEGLENRKVYSTSLNVKSSRSHAILQVFIDLEETNVSIIKTQSQESNSTQTSPSNQENVQKFIVRRRKLVLVDLAGSERVSSHRHTSKQQLKEASIINKSIAALGNCISALSSGTDLGHVPYRDTKLTRLLAESLGGNSKTCIFANISPCAYHYEETYSTLKFATRAKMVPRIVRNGSIDDLPLDTQLLTYVHKGKPPNGMNHNTSNYVDQSIHPNELQQYEDEGFDDRSDYHLQESSRYQHPSTPYAQQQHPPGYFSGREGRGSENSSLDPRNDGRHYTPNENEHYFATPNNDYDPSKPPLQYKRLLHGDVSSSNQHLSSAFSLKDFLKSCTTNNHHYQQNHSNNGSKGTAKTTNYDGSSNTSDIDDSTIQDDYYEGSFHQHRHPSHLQDLHPLVQRSASKDSSQYSSNNNSAQYNGLPRSRSQIRLTTNGIPINELSLSLTSIAAAGDVNSPNELLVEDVRNGSTGEISQFLSSDDYSASPRSSSFHRKPTTTTSTTTNQPATVDAFIQMTSKPLYPDQAFPSFYTSKSQTESRSSSPNRMITRQNSGTIHHTSTMGSQTGDYQSVQYMGSYQNLQTNKIMVDKAIQSNKLIPSRLSRKYDGSLNDFAIYTDAVYDKSTEMDYNILLEMNSTLNLEYYTIEEMESMKVSLQNPFLLLQQVMDLKKQLLERELEIDGLKKFILEQV